MKKFLPVFLLLAACGNCFAQDEFNPGILNHENRKAYAKIATDLKNSFSEKQKEQLKKFARIYHELSDGAMMLGIRLESTYIRPLNDSSYTFAASTEEALQGVDEHSKNNVKGYFTDIFSFEPDMPVYIPLYNRETEKIVSFILLSAGIDGQINHKFEAGEKLYTDNWRQKIRAYNMEFIQKMEKSTGKEAEHVPNGILCVDPDSTFDIADFLWGDKDLIIRIGSDTYGVEYRNGEADYKNAEYLKTDR